jgi:hypothetical protein
MPLLNRQPEPAHAKGLLVLLALLLLAGVVRYFDFFRHQVWGAR